MKMKMKGKPEFYPKVILLGTILPFLDMVAPRIHILLATFDF